MDKTRLAENIRTGRARLNLTRVEFAKEAGLTTNTLRALEKGTHTRMPDTKTLAKIAKVLSTTTESLFSGKLPIEPDDALLRDLTDEDLLIARAYHHSKTPLRQRVAVLLDTSVVDHLMAMASRLDRLPPEIRATFEGMLTDAEQSLSAAKEREAAKPDEQKKR